MKNKNVLIVEDQLLFQSFLNSALKNILPETTNIIRKNSGNSAIELLSENIETIELIFLDIKMDDGDGISVLRYLSGKNKNNVPIYIVSSLDEAFVNYVMASISELDVRIVGFIPKGAPNSVYSRIEKIRKDINFYVNNDIQTKKKHRIRKKKTLHEVLHYIKHDLMIYIQPKFSLEHGNIAGFEVLSRICCDEVGIIEPDVFIPLINKYDLNLVFAKEVLRKAFIFHSQLSRLGLYIDLSINIELSTLESMEFGNELDTLAKKYNVNLNFISFDVIQSTCEDLNKTKLNIAQMKLKGIKFVLDGFGKGTSNIDTLNDIPFDEIKLDNGLINTLSQPMEYESGQLVSSVIDYLVNKNYKVTAKGIESVEEVAKLAQLGCHMGQGYFYCLPFPANDIHSLYSKLFMERVSKIVSETDSSLLNSIYDRFFIDTTAQINDFVMSLISSNDETPCEKERQEFVHNIKGSLKTSGILEGLPLLYDYQETNDFNYLLKLIEMLSYFKVRIVKEALI